MMDELSLALELLASDLEAAQVLCRELRKDAPKDRRKAVFLALLDDSLDRVEYQAGEIKEMLEDD